VTTFSPSRIRQARIEASLSRNDLAMRARTSEKNIARWERGEHTPRLEHIAAIAEATGREIGFFLSSNQDDELEAVSAL
jgi:transcriptional regulator with XRE-family HTH domain